MAQTSALIKLIDTVKYSNNESELFQKHQTQEVQSENQVRDESYTKINSKQISTYNFLNIQSIDINKCEITFQKSLQNSTITLSSTAGSYLNHNIQTNKSKFVPIESQMSTLSLMMQSYVLNYDICLVGTKGCGKSVLTEYFTETLGYLQPEKIFCYKDMTPRDLLQRRR